MQPPVDPLDPFVIPVIAPATENLEELAKPIRWILIYRFLRTSDDGIVSGRIGLIAIYRIVDAHDPAGPPQADRICCLSIVDQVSSCSRL